MGFVALRVSFSGRTRIPQLRCKLFDRPDLVRIDDIVNTEFVISQ
jgi:hypothetical protein